MSVLAKAVSITSKPNSLHLQRHRRRHIIRSGKNMLAESEPTYENVAFVSGRVISRFLHKLAKVDTARSSLLRRRTQEKFAR